MFWTLPEVSLIFRFRNDTLAISSKHHHGLNGKIIRAVVVVAPIATCKRVGGGYAGAEIEMMEAIASALNITLEYNSSMELSRENDSQHAALEGGYGP